PELKVVVLEAAFAGFGASGRNGGWVTAETVGSRKKYARGPAGVSGVRALEAALRDTVDEIAGVCATEEIDCGFVRGGPLSHPPPSTAGPAARRPGGRPRLGRRRGCAQLRDRQGAQQQGQRL